MIRVLSCLLFCGVVSVPAVAGGTNDPLQDWLQLRGYTTPALPGAQRPAPAAKVVVHAMGFLGAPYVSGGDSSYREGLDCSGFVQAVYRQVMGLRLPRRSHEQADAATPIDGNTLQPGDLVFFDTQGRPNSHVGIYVGDGRFIHSPRSGSVVRLEQLSAPYWQQRFNGARRVDAVPAALAGLS